MTDAQQLHRDSIIIDGLNASWFLDDGVIERIHRGRTTAVNATIAAWHDPGETLDMIGQFYRQLDRHGQIAMQVRSAADIHTAKAAGKTGFILGFQDTNPTADRLYLLRAYYEIGVRIIQLTYNFERRCREKWPKRCWPGCRWMSSPSCKISRRCRVSPRQPTCPT